ncbi:ABC transporter transmembrane domain-containing protein [Macrococcoides caseolyticum]|uniref:ABC transporter transmembrane domain-containing protein n=1 Tax=Macrococcoides caseolyticum TaxID=69966 RepID=UPI0030EB731B
MKFLTKLSFNYRWTHFMFFVLSILLSIIIVLQSVQIGKVVDAVLYHHKIDFTFVLFTIFVILISRSSVQMALKVTGNAISIKVKHELRAFLSKKKDDAGTVMNNIQQGIEGVHPFFSDYLPQVYRSTFIPCSILIFLCFFHYQTALIMLITAPFIPIFYIIIGINTEKEATRQMLSLNRFSNYFLNVMKGIMTIKAFDYEEKALKQTAQYSERYKEHTMKILKTAFLSTLMLEFISMLSIGIIALEIGLSLLVFHSVSFYTSVVVLMLAPEFYNALKDLGLAFHTGKTAAGYGEILSEQMTEPVSQVEYITEDIIRFTDVRTYYDNSEFSLDIPELDLPLDHYTIAGASGSGKSTFAKLLCNRVPFEGQMSLSNKLQNEVVYLSQFDAILSDSVINNITMFNDYDFEQVVALAKKFRLHERFITMSDGYDTIIGPEGEQLSGGEMRRLSLMRVFLYPKKLIILDEPTAMLDKESRDIILSAVEELKSYSYVMMIAHHEATVKQSKQLLYIKNGHVKRFSNEEMRLNNDEMDE